MEHDGKGAYEREGRKFQQKSQIFCYIIAILDHLLIIKFEKKNA